MFYNNNHHYQMIVRYAKKYIKLKNKYNDPRNKS